MPSARRAKADRIPHVTHLQHTLDEIRANVPHPLSDSGIPAMLASSRSLVAPDTPDVAVVHAPAEPPVPPDFIINNPPPLDKPDMLVRLTALAVSDAIPMDVEYSGDPSTLEEAMSGPFKAEWLASLLDELKSIKDLSVYKLILRSQVPAGHRILKGKPTFQLKRNKKGEPVRFKSRWCTKGFQQVYGLDYN